STRGVRMISSSSRAWMPTRSLWNQHAYHVDNILDDGSVPAAPVRSWLTHNTFRLNTFPDRDPLGLPDLAIFDLRLSADESAVELLATNRGLAPSTNPVKVEVFAGEGGVLLGALDVPPLAAGESLSLSITGLAASAVTTNLHARIDVANAVIECAEDNNFAAAGYFEVRATDPEGLFDSQRFTATVENVNEHPWVVTTGLPPATANKEYRFSIEA